MVTHSSKSSLRGRACSRAASTWTQKGLRPLFCLLPPVPTVSGPCPQPSPGAPVSLWDWPSAGGPVPRRCCHGRDRGAPVPGGATAAPAAWGSIWFHSQGTGPRQTSPILEPRDTLHSPLAAPTTPHSPRILLSRPAPMLCQHTQPEDRIAPHLRVSLPGGAQQHREEPGHELG